MTFTYDYERAGITCDVVLLYCPGSILLSDQVHKKDFEVVLIKRNIDPYKNHWALPGGYMEIGETLEECAMREVKEEVGLDIDNLIPIGWYDSLGRNIERVISAAFVAILTQKSEIEVADKTEIKSVKWKNMADVGKEKLAFDHKDIVRDGYYTVSEARFAKK